MTAYDFGCAERDGGIQVSPVDFGICSGRDASDVELPCHWACLSVVASALRVLKPLLSSIEKDILNGEFLLDEVFFVDIIHQNLFFFVIFIMKKTQHTFLHNSIRTFRNYVLFD